MKSAICAIVLLVALLVIPSCDASSPTTAPIPTVQKSIVSPSNSAASEGFSLSLITNRLGIELTLQMSADLTTMMICGIPSYVPYAALFKWDEAFVQAVFQFPVIFPVSGGCITGTAPFTAYIYGGGKGGVESRQETFASFPVGGYLFDLRNAEQQGVDEVTFVLPEAAPWSLSDLGDEVNELLESGALNGGQANALHATLNAATRQTEAGSNTAAVGSLGAFINQLEALERSGRLTASQTQPLIAAAQALISSLGG